MSLEVSPADGRESVLDQHVDYYLRNHPEFNQKHRIAKIEPAVYKLDGRVIQVDWEYGAAGAEGQLIVVDGPLRQPFDDYVRGNEVNAQFDENRLPRSSLHQIPKGRQMSFRDDGQVYSRLEAMKVAKEQALVREKAAEYASQGLLVPETDLMAKYQKAIDIKLGNRWRRQASPPAPTSPRLPPPSQPSPAIQGAPVYCSIHSSKRPKTVPRSMQCSSCHATVQTNYVECSLCPACSQSQNRCVCCGCQAGAAPANGNGRADLVPKAELPTPAYCANHDTSEKRTKTQPRPVTCGTCGTVIETNYVDFAICAHCSNSTQCCLCCGNPADPSAAPSRPNTSAMYNRPATTPRPFDGAASLFNLGLPSLDQMFNPLLPATGRMIPQQAPWQNAYASPAAPPPTYNALGPRSPMPGWRM